MDRAQSTLVALMSEVGDEIETLIDMLRSEDGLSSDDITHLAGEPGADD